MKASLRTSFLDDITSFLSNEIEDFHHLYGSFNTMLPSKSAKEVKMLNLETTVHVRRVTQPLLPNTKLDSVAEKVVQAFTQNKTEPNPKKQKAM